MKVFIGVFLILFISQNVIAGNCEGNGSDELLCETRQIKFLEGENLKIKEKAEALGSVVSIYEYVRNSHSYQPYFGARSRAINNFLSMEGNDTDLASLFIAMLRSVDVKSRYVIGDIRLLKSELANWMRVGNGQLAVSILESQGIKIVDNTDSEFVVFEHVWVEALIDFSEYRGLGETESCETVSKRCSWVSLDPSFKLYTNNSDNKDLLSQVNFDYDAYYGAETNSALKGKHPLEIFEEQALAYLRDNHPGITLEDVIGEGDIIVEELGLLPSSLPYEVMESSDRYNSIAEIASDRTHSWERIVLIKIELQDEGQTCYKTNWAYSTKYSDLSVEELLITTVKIDGNYKVAFRGQRNEVLADSDCSGNPLQLGDQYNIHIWDDYSRGDQDSPPVNVSYQYHSYNRAVVGSSTLIAKGGYESNWSQVERAYKKLLEASNLYPVLTDDDYDVYLDVNSNGLIDSNESLLSENNEANVALTSGILNLAQRLYYVRYNERAQRYSRLKNSETIIGNQIGLISSIYDVDSIDGAPFSITPAGLLLDMVGALHGSVWKSDEDKATNEDAFIFGGHIGSSLEHEVWQEITGNDALSTLRAFQLAKEQGMPVYNVHNTSSSLLNSIESTAPNKTFDEFMSALGFSKSVPNSYHLVANKSGIYYGRKAQFMEGDIYGPRLHVVKSDPNKGDTSGGAVEDFRTGYNFQMNSEAWYWGLRYNYDWATENSYKAWAGSRVFDNINGDLASHLHYKVFDSNSNDFGISFLDQIASDLFLDLPQVYEDYPDHQFMYIVPTGIVKTDYSAYTAYIRYVRSSTGEIFNGGYYIQNEYGRANGAYAEPVDPSSPPAELVEEAVGFGLNNEILNSSTNNDLTTTPSTVDPVSTVTGNMYHDETDLVIAGRDLAYTFTRTYNSNETKIDGPESTNPNYLPLSQGWTHSYNIKLVSSDYGETLGDHEGAPAENTNNLTSSIIYLDERGGEKRYLVNDAVTNSQPTPPAMNFDDLKLNTPSTGLHTLTFTNGTSYIFNSQNVDIRVPNTVARLHKIVSPYGSELNFGYTGTQLTSITDNLNQTARTGLTLTYYTTGEHVGRLHTLSDWTGRTWEYLYDGGKLSSVVNPLNDSMQYTYVGDTHWLKDIIQPQDRNGKKKIMTFGYFDNGQAFNYVDQNGSEESLSYDLYRNTTRVTNPNGNSYAHHYDDKGALVKLERADKGILLFENNVDGLRYVKYNALGQRTRYSYRTDKLLISGKSNTQGLVTKVEDALGNSINYDYGLYGQISSSIDKNGHTVYNYITAFSDPESHQVQGKTYKLLPIDVTVDGVNYNFPAMKLFEYFPDGTVKQKKEALALEEGIYEVCNVYHPGLCWDLPRSIQTSSRTTDYTYSYADDGSYQVDAVVSVDDADSITTTTSYDNLWRKVATTVSRKTSATDDTLIEITNHFEYDVLSRVVKTTDPIGNIFETLYDKNGKVYQKIARYKLTGINDTPLHQECTIDAGYSNYHSCVLVTNYYDAADRLTSSVDIMGATTSYQFDAMGNITKATNQLGNSLVYEYDKMERQTKVTNENGYAVETKYDLAGNIKSVTDANGNTVSYTYDAIGQLLTTTSPEGRVTKVEEYDGNGNILRMSDANHAADANVTSVVNTFDEFNRVISTLNAQGEQTQYTYNAQGKKSSVIDALGQVTQFKYNGLGQLITVIDPIIESGTDKVVSMTYDELGNRLTYTDRLGEVTRYVYDKLNRPTQEHYLADDVTANKVYDQYGDMVSTSYDGITYAYEYDAAHRLVKKIDSRNNLSMSWQYNQVGSLIEKRNYQGEIYKYIYDSTNRLVSMSIGAPVALQASYHYDPAGRLLSRILSNGVATYYTYSPDGFLNSMKQVGADKTVLDERAYEYDEVGNIVKLTINNSEVIDYGYDNAYRLLSANSTINSHDISYTYDAVGNRLTKTANGVVHHYIVGTGNRLNSVRLNSVTGAQVYRFDYDANGSMIKKYNSSDQQILEVDYDQRRLASVMNVATPDTDLSFKYDANFYRIEKHQSSATKQYMLEGEHLESLYNENDELEASYLRGAVVDEIITGFEKSDAGVMQSRNFHHDQVNSVLALSDHNGVAKQTLSYGPFGERFESSGSSHNAMQYTGREQDSESGLYYYRARYYDPELGRFISEDPIGTKGGINFYAYVGNNPLIYSDPSGNVKFLSGILRDSAAALSNSAIGLKKQINSANQLSLARNGVGSAMHTGSDIRDVNRLTSEYGGEAGGWSKMTSDAYTAQDGQVISTHWYQNSSMDLNVEFKSIANEWTKKAGVTFLEGGSAILLTFAVIAEILDPAVLTSPGYVPEGYTETWYGYKKSDDSDQESSRPYASDAYNEVMKNVYACP